MPLTAQAHAFWVALPVQPLEPLPRFLGRETFDELLALANDHQLLWRMVSGDESTCTG